MGCKLNGGEGFNGVMRKWVIRLIVWECDGLGGKCWKGKMGGIDGIRGW